MKLPFSKDKVQKIKTLCRAHKVKELFVFGSILTEKFHSDSDIDFLVSFQPIDVLVLKQQIDATKVKIYGSKSSETTQIQLTDANKNSISPKSHYSCLR